MEGFLSVKEATKSYAQGCKAKAATPIGKLFGKAMLAGMMIGMGAAASSVAAHSVANVGLARLTAAVVFPVGLMMVILLGAELFTGDCLMALGVAEKHISVADCIRVLVLVFLGNFAGALIFTALVYCSGQLERGVKNASLYTLEKIACALELSLTDLVGNSDIVTETAKTNIPADCRSIICTLPPQSHELIYALLKQIINLER